MARQGLEKVFQVVGRTLNLRVFKLNIDKGRTTNSGKARNNRFGISECLQQQRKEHPVSVYTDLGQTFVKFGQEYLLAVEIILFGLPHGLLVKEHIYVAVKINQFGKLVQISLLVLSRARLSHIIHQLLCAGRIIHGFMLDGAEAIVKHLIHYIQPVFLVTEFSAGCGK